MIFICTHCKNKEDIPVTGRDAITCAKCSNLAFREGLTLTRPPRKTSRGWRAMEVKDNANIRV